MRKLILVSILFAMVALPMRAAADPSPIRGARKVIVWLAAFNVFYLVAVIYILPRLP